MRGRMARRRRTTLRPTAATDSPCFRASRAKARSIRANQPAPSRGQANADAIAIPAKPHSRIDSEALGVEAKGSSIRVTRSSMRIPRRSLRFYGKIRVILPRIPPPEPVLLPWGLFALPDPRATPELLRPSRIYAGRRTPHRRTAVKTHGRAGSGGGGFRPALLSRGVVRPLHAPTPKGLQRRVTSRQCFPSAHAVLLRERRADGGENGGDSCGYTLDAGDAHECD